MERIKKQKTREYQKKYYQKNKYELCLKTIGIYADKSIAKMNALNYQYIQYLYQEYPFEKYGDRCIKRICCKYRIRHDSYLYDECYSIGAKAYMYTIGMCSVKNVNEKLICGYLYVVTRIFIICVINTSDEVKQICNVNGLSRIDVQHFSV